MNDKIFIDTNLWIYLYADASDREKTQKISGLIDKHFEDINISTQVLGEVFNVLTKKALKEKEEARQMILDLVSNFSVAEILQPSVMKAIDLSILYGYSYWDSLILATAIDNGCSILYTEDMQDGQVVDGKLKILNPFTMKQ
ncbi:MAG: PIN domain-containing protein [Nitrospirae bacterium]|jgi:predicted nucleic acid-binding protein|nr:PIN domain-containing protein [Nitrospirota bacterium]